MSRPIASWLAPPRAATPVVTDPAERRRIGTEILVVLTITLGLSALRSALDLISALLQTVPLNQQQVALNAPASPVSLVDLALQLTGVLQLLGWGMLAAYLLLRAGFALRTVGLTPTGPAATRWAPSAWPR
jgi:hypothetical protein